MTNHTKHSLAQQIQAKQAQAADLSAQLTARYGIEHALQTLGIPYDADATIRVAQIRRPSGQIVALRVNGTEHRLAEPVTPAQWEVMNRANQ
jgi:hypothetical protein